MSEYAYNALRLIGKCRSNGDLAADAYIGGETPPFGSIDCIEDFMVAMVQKRLCSSCRECYWNGNCDDDNIAEEANRIADLMDSKKKAPKPEPCFDFATCKDCVHATQTNPRICMNPKSIAKHSYVTDTSYCDQFEPL